MNRWGRIVGLALAGGWSLVAAAAEDPPLMLLPLETTQAFPTEPPRTDFAWPGTALAANVPAEVVLTNAAAHLSVDALVKEYEARPCETSATLQFALTNTAPVEISIPSVRTSCWCTIAQLPGHPWRLAPGASGQFSVVADLRGKYGILAKSVFVDAQVGNGKLTTKSLAVRVKLPANPVAAMVADPRTRNQQLARADRQAALKGECAKCHVEPGVGKLGAELYAAVCGVCHEAEHRATMVPDLNRLPHATDWQHWRQWITYGRANSLMPAFAASAGGPLTEAQVDSLVQFLTRTIPGAPAGVAAFAGVRDVPPSPLGPRLGVPPLPARAPAKVLRSANSPPPLPPP